jgi:hypothetical protein
MSTETQQEAPVHAYDVECGDKAFKLWVWAAIAVWEAAFVLCIAYWPDSTWSIDMNKLDMEVLVVPSPTAPAHYASFTPSWQLPLNGGENTPANYCVTKWAAPTGGTTVQKQEAAQPLKRVGLSQFTDEPGDQTCQGLNAGVPARITGYVSIRLKNLDRHDLLTCADNNTTCVFPVPTFALNCSVLERAFFAFMESASARTTYQHVFKYQGVDNRLFGNVCAFSTSPRALAILGLFIILVRLG